MNISEQVLLQWRWMPHRDDTWVACRQPELTLAEKCQLLEREGPVPMGAMVERHHDGSWAWTVGWLGRHCERGIEPSRDLAMQQAESWIGR